MKHSFILDGAKILGEYWDGNTLIPLYDNEDNVCGILHNDIPYYFLKNLPGDVIAITNQRGETVARYTYDAWGSCTITYDATATPTVEGGEPINIATVNPFRYRSYYFDTETGLYYLQSRYYDPVLGRFAGTDKVMGANDDHAAYALYTYCGNCPVDRYDSGGESWKKIWNGVKNTVRTVLNKTNKILIRIGIDTAALGAFALDMWKDKTGVYHANFDCWQQYFGFNDFYDFIFDLATSMKNKKFEFKSGSTWYVLWAWKGNYINLGAGAELGIYYCKHSRGPHWFVDKKLAMDMSMKVKYRNATIINYRSKTWWITGFNPNPKYLDVKASDLKVSFEVSFNREDLYNSFKKAHANRGTWTFPRKSIAKYTF